MITRIIVGDVELKAHVPFDLKEIPKSFPGKKWVPGPSNKYWTMPATFVDELAAALRAAGSTVVITRADGHPWRNGKAAHGPRSTPAGDWADRLFDAIGPNLREPMFKACSRILHPDAGGDTALQQQLNSARERAAFTRKKAS